MTPDVGWFLVTGFVAYSVVVLFIGYVMGYSRRSDEIEHERSHRG